jgi:queuine tRNA-ribosyltransferase
LLTEIVQFTRDLVPREIPMHALGIGHPQSVIDTFKMGYEIFDCALPTRDARHGRLYIGDALSDWRMLYIADDKHIKTHTPLDAECDCPTCQTYSVGYLHHLYKIKETLYYRLATLHNLRFMARLMRALTE